MTQVATLMQSYDALAQLQASLESCENRDLYHDSLAMYAVDSIRARHPGLPKPSMEGFADLFGNLGQAISTYWNNQLRNSSELHAYRAGTHPTQHQVQNVQLTPVPVEAKRVFNSQSSASVLGLYGAESYLTNGDSVIAECEKLIHSARDLLQGFKINKIIREATDEHPFTLRITDQAMRYTSVSNYRRLFGINVFETYDVGLPFSSPRFSDAFRTSDLMKDFRKKFAADAVTMKFARPEKVYTQAKSIVEIASPEFIRVMNNIEERIIEITQGKSKFEDPDFAFDDGEADTLAFLTWDSVRHVAVAVYSFSYNNALAIYNTLSKVEAP